MYGVSILLDKLRDVLQMRQLQMENTEDFRPAAILIPLVRENEEWRILFEVRAQGLKWQPGDVCFPGGRVEVTDQSPADTVVREVSEELGIAPGDLELLGPLDFIVSPIGVMVYPYVGIIRHFEAAKINTEEVAEVFTVPLAYLENNPPIVGHMESATRPSSDFPLHLLPKDYKQDWKKRFKYAAHFYSYGDKVIWGLTGRILHRFIQLYREIS